MMQEHRKLHRVVTALLLAVSVPLLYLLSRYSYNLFHSLADGLTIVIAACAFVVVWNSRRNVDNNYFTYVGISLLFFAFLDLIHMLGNKNMGAFPGYGNLGPTFYIASRYLLSISLVIAPLFINRKLNTGLMFLLYSLATSLVLLSVFYWKIFPACIIEGVGLTPFKVVSDYIICLILMISIVMVVRNRHSFDLRIRKILVSSIVLSVATGLTFTLYTDPFGVTNMVGHLLQIASFYLIYVAIIQTGMTKPQQILFRKLKQNEEVLAENVQQLQQEIAERKRTEEALRESEQRFMKVFYQSPSAMIVTRLSDGRVIDVNDAALKLFEYSRDETIGRRVIEDLNCYVNPADRTEMVRSLHENGTMSSREVRMRTKTGKNITVLFSVEIVSFGSEENAACTTLLDVTQRKQAEEAIRESEERYRIMGETLPYGVWLCNPHGGAEYVSQSFLNLLEMTQEEMREFGWTHRLPPEDAEPMIKKWLHCVETGEPWDSEHRVFGSDGNYHTVLTRGRPVRNEKGEITCWVGINLDIDERKQMEEEIRTARDELERRVRERTSELEHAYRKLVEETEERKRVEHQLRQAQKLEALGTLSGGIAHDFNNILAAIIGFGELIRDHLPKEDRERRHIERVLQAGMRGRELVKQMLTFSRQAEQEKKPLRLSSIVKETTKLLRASIPTTISIKTTVKSESGVILGDPVQIQQVLMNLATNAGHAMQEKGGVLDIELSDFSVGRTNGNSHGIPPGLYMRLVVRDTGSGIAPEMMDKIFDPFFTTKKMGEGTGLGLSVVMGIVKQAHGYIRAESEPGKGSTFTVYFPKIEEQARTEETRQEEIPTGQERILLVDDEEALVEMGEDILAELGYEVTCRTSSREALALFRLDPSRFDLVITDQTMPDLTGVELASELLRIRPGLPVVLATGFSHVVNEDSAKATGLKGYVMKPLTKREIAKTIRKILDEERS